ncbi:polysaccharide biosynthesis/export family protein [Posidoniimonas polymericola]|nr:polysaccharide biosynthesis/export family protein [Posidoniimonas polymericola]
MSRRPGAFGLLLLGLGSLLQVGCAAVTNPTANGVPAHALPPELLAESKEGYSPVDLTLLRVPPPEVYLLDVGDTLGVYVEGIVGSVDAPPPVSVADSTEKTPSIGYPFPIRDDGNVSLPMVGNVPMKGLTIEKAEQAIIQAYLDKEILRPNEYRIIVSLMRSRTVGVVVVREDSRSGSVTLQNNSLIGIGGSSTTIGGEQKPSGQIVDLPAYQNDLLNALARTGGLPSVSGGRDILIYRGSAGSDGYAEAPCRPLCPSDDPTIDGERIIRIPLRTKNCESVHIPREDIVLHDGDIVVVRGRNQETYYTGGILPSSVQSLPLDRDLNVIEAVLRARGQLLSGGLSTSNLNGSSVGSGVGNPSPSQLAILRETPGGQQVMIRVDLNEALRDPRLNLLVQADDVLILQENTDEAFARYVSQAVQFDFFFRILNRSDAQGGASVILP